jgi:hypothetical protein
VRSIVLFMVIWLCTTALQAQMSESVILNDARGAKTDLVIRGASFKASASGLTVLPIQSGFFYNSKFAWGPNLGSLWLGKGFTQGLSGGVRVSSRFLDVQLNPVLFASENRYFTQPNDGDRYRGLDLEKYDNVRGNIDAPHRIHETAFSRVLPGDSWAKVRLWKLAGGVSTENLWWGPGKRNSLLLSNHAPGFLHATGHTTTPINLYAFDLESQMVVGFLEPSYGLDDWRADYRIIFNGIILSLSPRFDKNLKFGLIRTFILNENDITSNKGYFPLFQPFLKSNLDLRPDNTPNDPDDQRASAFVSWAFPRVNFHVYGEYARDDHNADLKDLYLQPNHNRAFLFGFQKRWNTSNGLYSFSSEFVQAESSNTKVVRGSEVFYTHTRVERGYTNRGENLANHYGHGSNGWYASVYRMRDSWTTGVMVERVARNKELYQWIKETRKPTQPEVETTVGLVGWYRSSRMDVGVEVYRSFVQDRFMVGLREVEGGPRYSYDPVNLNIQLTVTYRPGLRWGR